MKSKASRGWNIPIRYGAPVGMLLAMLWSGNAVLQARRHAIGPSARGLVVFSYLFLFITLACVFLAGVLTARKTGFLSVGIRAGALVGAIPGFVLVFVVNLGTANHEPRVTSAGQLVYIIVIQSIAGLLVAAFCGGVGALVSIPGALIGRSQCREQYPIGAPLPPEMLAQEDNVPALDAIAPLPDALPDTIAIYPSGPKIILLTLLALAFAAASYQFGPATAPFPSQNAIIGLLGLGLFGLGAPCMFVALLCNRPLIRFTDDGITYKGGLALWTRGQVAWEDVHVIMLVRASSAMFGKHDLVIWIRQKPGRLRFLNWQLPRSTRKSLQLVMFRYRQQIEEHDILLRGVQ